MRIIRLHTTPSTQDVARDLPPGTVVVAEQQTAGRGRLDRRWETRPGSALLASFVLPARSLASLAAGVAAASACGEAARLKWPNDLLLDGGKLAGILVENRGDRCIVGIGVNVLWAPPGASRLEVDREQLLQRLWHELQRWFAAPDSEILAAWRARADTLGRRVRVELHHESFDGFAEDIAPDGSLIVDGRAVSAGDIVHLRDSRPPSPLRGGNMAGDH